MEYFIAITSDEVPFSDFVAESNVLVSPSHFAARRNQYKGTKRLRSLYIDSGAYHHNTRRSAKGQRSALDEQLRLVEVFPPANVTALLHCDVLPRRGISPDDSVRLTLKNAVEFSGLAVDPAIQKIGVAQARTPEEMFFVASFLLELGFEQIAIGGLANQHQSRGVKASHMIEAACEAAGDAPIHALGVSAPTLLPVLRRNAIASCDSASPIWAAVYGILLYSAPFRRFRLRSAKSEHAATTIESGFHRALETPLPCKCPVCQVDPNLLCGTDVMAKHFRSIHNYIHMRCEIEGVDTWALVSSSADSLFAPMNSNGCTHSSADENARASVRSPRGMRTTPRKVR